ncbi:MAG: DUF3160 domain-containing protein [Anaerolineae bacterium]|nr:DUF3160 domain-containing protein [Anaerolineae bacterium]
MKVKRFMPVIFLVVAMLACGPATPEPTTQPPPTSVPLPTASPTTPGAPLPDVRGPGFASYMEIGVRLPEVYEGYTLPVDMASVSHSFVLNDAQIAMLAQNGFVVVPSGWKEFFQVYEQNRYRFLPTFVTTDSVYHVYHLLFDKMLRDLEREHFEPDIAALTRACVQSAQQLYTQFQGTEMESVALRVWAYFSVADNLINTDATIPPEIASLVEQELALIDAHAGLQASPIFSYSCPEGCDPCATDPPLECLDQPCMCEDYSQYVPRGHYTRSEQLERYFRAMMWYGRINMRLQRPDETRMALLITYILRNTSVDGDPADNVWARVYDPTAFIVGKSDDLGFHEYGGLWDVIYGPEAGPEAIADDALLTAFIDAARQLPPPQVNSMWVYIWEDEEQVTQGFRFMGQRFTLDAYIFEQLIWREVGVMGNERWLPMGLDVMAAMGSDEAYTVLEELGETQYANYPEQMTRLRSEIGGLELDSWTQNLYWNWLYTFQPLLEPHGQQYPAFMQTQAWARRELYTALGSWTELKHDTILYAKQVMAEMGGGGNPEIPRGWVEPNPEVYARLLALTRMTREGLENRGLMTENTAANLARLDDLLVFLQDVSEQILAGEELTEDDIDRIHYYGGELEVMTLAAADPEEGVTVPFFDEDDQAALIADVATDPNGYVQEEATGRIFEIYVVMPDGRGGLQLARGGTFSYYEFRWPMSDRLTDEAWWAMIDGGQLPERPVWTEAFISE